MEYLIYTIPFISALIGYVTNYLAIFMLFRPYRDFKILKLTLFRKGLIPQNHQRIAQSIGHIVSKELLTPDDFLSKVHSDEIDQFLKKFIHSKFQTLIKLPLESVAHYFPSLAENKDTLMNDQTSEQFTQYVLKLCSQEKFDLFIFKFLSQFKKINLHEWTQNDSFQQIISKLSTKISQSIENNLSPKEIYQLLKSIINDPQLQSQPLNHLINPQFIHNLNPLMKEFLKDVAGEIIEIVEQEQNQSKLREKIKGLINDYLKNSTLGMLASFIPPNLIDNLSVHFAQKGTEELTFFLNDEKNIEQLIEIINTKVQSFLSFSVKDLINQYSLENIDFVLTGISSSIENLIKTENCRLTIQSLIQATFQQILKSPDNIEMLLNEENLQLISLKVKELILNSIKNNSINLKFVLLQFFDLAIETKLSSLIHIIPEEIIQKLEDYIYKFIKNQVSEHLIDLVETIDLAKMVEEKVLNFPLPQLESIIRKIAHRELNYITILGGVLGFIIGIFQLVLIQFL